MEPGLRDNPVMDGSLAGGSCGAGGPWTGAGASVLRSSLWGFWCSHGLLATKEWGFRVRLSKVLGKTLDTAARGHGAARRRPSLAGKQTGRRA